VKAEYSTTVASKKWKKKHFNNAADVTDDDEPQQAAPAFNLNSEGYPGKLWVVGPPRDEPIPSSATASGALQVDGAKASGAKSGPQGCCKIALGQSSFRSERPAPFTAYTVFRVE
jgi:hypothetical protein